MKSNKILIGLVLGLGLPVVALGQSSQPEPNSGMTPETKTDAMSESMDPRGLDKTEQKSENQSGRDSSERDVDTAKYPDSEEKNEGGKPNMPEPATETESSEDYDD